MISGVKTDGLLETLQSIGREFETGIFIFLVNSVYLREVIEGEIVQQRMIYFLLQFEGPTITSIADQQQFQFVYFFVASRIGWSLL